MPCPQPPLLLFLGRFLLSLADGNVGLVRLWQVLQHVLTACCVWGITHRLFKQHAVSTLAGCTFLFLPEGVWWSAGYQSEPLLVFLQSFNLLLLLNAMAGEKPSPALYGAAFIAATRCRPASRSASSSPPASSVIVSSSSLKCRASMPKASALP